MDPESTNDGQAGDSDLVPRKVQVPDFIRRELPSTSTPVPRGEIPDRLTDEDELILDRIWDEIGRENGVESMEDAAANLK